MTHDIYFGNLHEDTVGEAYLDLPNKVLARPRAFLFQSLRSRKEKANGGQRHPCDSDQDRESQVELNEAKRISRKRRKSRGTAGSANPQNGRTASNRT